MLKPLTSQMLVDNCGIPQDYAEAKLSDMNFGIYPNSEQFRDGLVLIESKLKEGDFIKHPLFLTLDGSFGNGKTRVACHLLAAAYDGFRKCRNKLVDPVEPRFLKASLAARKRFDDDSAEKLFVEEAYVLVIDDVNRVSGYKGEMEYLEDAIEDRFQKRLSTILTFNVDISTLNPRFGSFLRQFVNVSFGNAPDQRACKR